VVCDEPVRLVERQRRRVVRDRLQVDRPCAVLGTPGQQRVDDLAPDALPPVLRRDLDRGQPEPLPGDDATTDGDRRVADRGERDRVGAGQDAAYDVRVDAGGAPVHPPPAVGEHVGDPDGVVVAGPARPQRRRE